MVPRAATLAPGAQFLILRAGAGTQNLETVLHERRQELRADGVRGLDLDNAVALWRQVYMLAVRGEPVSAAARVVSPYLEKPWYRAAFGAGLERAFASSAGAPREVVVLADAPHSFLVSGADGEVRFSGGFFDRMARWMEQTCISRGTCVGGG